VETYWKSAATPFGTSSLKHARRPSRSPSSATQGPPVKSLLPVMSDSTITSSSLVGHYAHVIVQVTRDLVPVVWASWHIHVSGLSIGVGDVTAQQFLQLQPSNDDSTGTTQTTLQTLMEVSL
jgi:CDK inhibitor PHO81